MEWNQRTLRVEKHSNSRIRRPLCVADLVGNTPLLWCPDIESTSPTGFWAKLEGHNPGGMKDRAALHMVRRAREQGSLQPGAPIVESTSGTLGIGLALAGLTYGHPLHIVADAELEPMMRRSLTARGAILDVVDQPHSVGGWQQARRERVARLLAEHPDAWCPDQYHNPDNGHAYAALADELIRDLGHVDVLVCSVGTGGHSAGIARRLRTRNPMLRVVGVDSVGSTIFGQPARPRLMRGLGSSIYPRNVDYEIFSEVHWVAANEAVWACRRLAGQHFASGGWSVGAVALVASWVARVAPVGTQVAAVFPDGPARYFNTIFDDDYCRAHDLLERRPGAEPAEIAHPTEREVVRWTRCTTVIDPVECARTGASEQANS